MKTHSRRVSDRGSVSSLRQMLSDLHDGRTTSRRLINEALSRCEECKTEINAFSIVSHQTAINAAEESDRRYAAGTARTLEGLPIAVKDLIDTKGIETSYGAEAYRGNVPTSNADVVQTLMNEGAIVVGKTTTHEFAWGVTTESVGFGDTLNPHDYCRIPGGSSGGTAAAIAFGAVTAGLGTDTGGSVRIPAALCGAVGFKPSFGKLLTGGIFPLAPTLDHVGLIGRHVDDVSVLAEPFGIVAAISGVNKRSRIGIIREIASMPLSEQVADIFDKVCLNLKSLYSWVSVEPGLLDGTYEAFAGILLSEAAIVHFGRNSQATIKSLYSAATIEKLEQAKGIAIGDYVRWQNCKRQLSEALSGLMAGVDFLVLPTCPCVAPKIGETSITIGSCVGSVREALMTYTAPFNLTGFPAISIPMPVPKGSLPLGLQIVARHGQDSHLLAVAAAIESALEI